MIWSIINRFIWGIRLFFRRSADSEIAGLWLWLSGTKIYSDYLSNRKESTKINLTYSSREEILLTVSQGSIIVPLLFNIFLCGLFWVISGTDFTSYSDDDTRYISGDTIDDVVKSFDYDSKNLFKWFLDNQMKINCNKFYLKIGSINIKSSTCEKLLGVKVDNKPNFS